MLISIWEIFYIFDLIQSISSIANLLHEEKPYKDQSLFFKFGVTRLGLVELWLIAIQNLSFNMALVSWDSGINFLSTGPIREVCKIVSSLINSQLWLFIFEQTSMCRLSLEVYCCLSLTGLMSHNHKPKIVESTMN